MVIRGYISADINYEGYISEISKFSHRNYKLGPVASLILMQYLERPYLSTYQIFIILKKMGKNYEMAYKNVHKRIKQLHSLKLIEIIGKESIDTERESMHNPKYYRLTTGGLFHLISKDKTAILYKNSGMGRKKIFQNYSDSIIFRTLLYPYFEEETLLQIKNQMLFTEIFSYLNKCCTITDTVIELIENNQG